MEFKQQLKQEVYVCKKKKFLLKCYLLILLFPLFLMFEW